jgi:hypothetical protein
VLAALEVVPGAMSPERKTRRRNEQLPQKRTN